MANNIPENNAPELDLTEVVKVRREKRVVITRMRETILFFIDLSFHVIYFYFVLIVFSF